MTELAVEQVITDDWRIHGSIYRSSQIFLAEQDRIFRRCWLYVGHESEVSEPGDYKTTHAGRQPVIVARGSDDGQVRVLLNRCRHRGSSVCQRARGNASYFRCPYHGWTYRNSGELRGVPYDDGYGDLDKDQLGLIRLPRVAQHAGFIFASFSPSGPDLLDYLGNAAPYLARAAKQHPGGIRLSAGAHKITHSGNWKLQMENTLDGYHFGFVHRSYLKTLADRAGGRVDAVKNLSENWQSVDLGGGHAVMEEKTNGAGSGGGVVGGLPFSVVVFPNLAVIGAQVRHVLPKAAERTEVLLYPVLGAGLPAEDNARILRVHEDFNGPAGAGTTDDLEIAFCRTGDGRMAVEDDWMVASRGVHREQPGDNGTVIGGALDELPHRAFYREWRRRMAGTE